MPEFVGCVVSNLLKLGANKIAGIILLCLGCVNLGYGLCALINSLDHGVSALAVGAAFAGVALVFILRNDDDAGEDNKA